MPRTAEKEETHNKIVRNKMFLHYHSDPDAKIKSQLKYYKRMLKNDDKAMEILLNPSASLQEILTQIKAYYKVKKIEDKIAKYKASKQEKFSLDF
jgi:hypothetical protein